MDGRGVYGRGVGGGWEESLSVAAAADFQLITSHFSIAPH